ncbi:hydroxypyruvate isomerase family protein [Lichenibacterium minor]|uniref:Hydroxypyruvate isomerase family protein n=1 Tax=Lichenibacterium minor TaxID=2316528 RepID=A0A4Q2U5Q8_9HYPH|nr:2-oxo-tetronate isomerase [Lichenibacterium minor]RYC30165.1 hydroxypyruvate isomerase family protein [Lichenibacterium minor]
MTRFAANLTLMFTELPFLDRFEAAAQAGFEAVEFLFPYDHPADEVGERLRRHGLQQALFNLPPGHWAAGERGLAALPDRADEMRAKFDEAVPYILATATPTVHLMAGRTDRSKLHTGAFRDAVAWTAERLNDLDVTLVLEPLNTRDNPGYHLVDFDEAAALIQDLALPNLRLQFDIYHCQIIHGDVTRRLEAMMPIIGHIQIASVPSRNEPDGEELNFPFLFDLIDELGYKGFVGCEYRPRTSTAAGLGWFVSARKILNTKIT